MLYGNYFLLGTDIPLASQNQFAWMQSGELHMTMGKSSSSASVPLDTRYASFESKTQFFPLLTNIHLVCIQKPQRG